MTNEPVLRLNIATQTISLENSTTDLESTLVFFKSTEEIQVLRRFKLSFILALHSAFTLLGHADEASVLFSVSVSLSALSTTVQTFR